MTTTVVLPTRIHRPGRIDRYARIGRSTRVGYRARISWCAWTGGGARIGGSARIGSAARTTCGVGISGCRGTGCRSRFFLLVVRARVGQIIRGVIVRLNPSFGFGRRNLANDFGWFGRIRVHDSHRDCRVVTIACRRLGEYRRNTECEYPSQDQLSRAPGDGLAITHAMSSFCVLLAGASKLRSEAITWVLTPSANPTNERRSSRADHAAENVPSDVIQRRNARRRRPAQKRRPLGSTSRSAEFHDPVGLPGLSRIEGEGLLPLCGILGDPRPGETRAHRFAVELTV